MLMLALALAAAAAPKPATPLDQCLGSGAAAQGVTLAMAACFGADYRRADATLNATYRAVMRRLPPARQAMLRAAQRDWIGRRDAACPLSTAPGAGTIEQLNRPACLAKQTRARTAWLRRYR
ncbi:lysozyme inhibitor LprI family protein [Sphingomonas morindae]|uniref:Lysozyme inhibitor LprI family protein n=1 Tax=Sphingomonas morindae TaxID=1541170 RepID=A0ABY4X5K2_9SPHN|nr:lysozyme inhibitor LprI family protein [Sphingomonas morindae]USI72193.1 lysozyme inhibitor LprI family protein [Sphingomonas morindae]